MSAKGLSQDHSVEDVNAMSAEGLSQDHLVVHDNNVSAEGLSRDHCLAALAAVRHALWFKVHFLHFYVLFVTCILYKIQWPECNCSHTHYYCLHYYLGGANNVFFVCYV